ncbi:ComEC/Rec2 family competence protein [Paraclostridium bifermentans]|uniref:ComEC/Rec2 family competence protein n=1 Tax=Paraclostridium bifermentans TaxID=1490 RepID=UPI001C0FBD84|nr:ComEC/Rec2 family competence protein [Paraclostridium bifermentans]MBS5953354.1 ComEC/Rec2 family competence protein [Paraclostridium bifermentans]MBU5288454.1 ComEC/Rec2 family competence protein [Paraclostridium bifermentans]
MRRPIFITFCIMISISFIVTSFYTNEDYKNDKNCTIEMEGLVKNKVNKNNYVQYHIEDYLINDYSNKIDIKPGQIISFKGTLKKHENFKDEKFDYSRYLKSKGYNGIVEINDYKIIGDNFIYIKLFNIKDKISKTIKYLYKDKSKFINSIILGEKEGIDSEANEIFSKTGVSHILALSGLHVSILITIIGFSFGRINNLLKFAFLAFILWSYSIMVGQSPSIIRAIVCSLISYLAIFVQKRSDSINNLSIVGISLIINNPYVIYNISFQLSFLATLSIIYFYGYINEKIKVKTVSLTLAANILTSPIVYLYFKNISIVCIVSNIVVVPLLSIIIYISILSAIVLPFSLILTKIMVGINTSIIDFIYMTLEFLYNINGSFIEFENSNKILVIVYYILVGIFMIYKEIKTIKEQRNELQGYHQEHEQQRI